LLRVERKETWLQFRLGYELNYSFAQPTPMILALSIHYSRASDIIIPDHLTTSPAVRIGGYRDGFGNWCTRLVAPGGLFQIRTDALVRDSGEPDKTVPGARQHAIEELPEEALVFLLGSRYCETDLLSQMAWDLFGQSDQGWARVQAICDYAHHRIRFDYQQARSTRTAFEAWNECVGVCRDYAHLAISLCRCMNIPARYCTGYLSDVGTPLPYPPGDFAAWMEVYLGGEWHTFDPRNNEPRIGRVLLARGRDACDVAIATTFGPNCLDSFKVWTDEAVGAPV
jgi:transglutaminase-like putative cysteine protease